MPNPTPRRHSPTARCSNACLLVLVASCGLLSPAWAAQSERRTAIVDAIEKASPAIVSINGQKTVTNETEDEFGDGPRRVNGMGTGVVIDPRGYIVTNHHVVDGVRQINVTKNDGTKTVAKLVAHDPYTDLAIIKIRSKGDLPLIRIGTSSDLMRGERVVAIGNAYGYEGTVTCGFISALNRSVRVSDTQRYHNLIQTDAAINPGNSGGPLLNVDGEMIGINVAVRVGAQLIGFAIPVDRAMAIVAELISAKNQKGLWHGVECETVFSSGKSRCLVTGIQPGSPAASAGVRVGDRIAAVDGSRVNNIVDFERFFLDRSSGQKSFVSVIRDGKSLSLGLALTHSPRGAIAAKDRYWSILGMKLSPVSSDYLKRLGAPYNGGLRVTAVRPNGPAANQGIIPGDVLVGMHKWETLNLDNVNYVLGQSDLTDLGKVKFYVVRGGETLFGHLPVIRR